MLNRCTLSTGRCVEEIYKNGYCEETPTICNKKAYALLFLGIILAIGAALIIKYEIIDHFDQVTVKGTDMGTASIYLAAIFGSTFMLGLSGYCLRVSYTTMRAREGKWYIPSSKEWGSLHTQSLQSITAFLYDNGESNYPIWGMIQQVDLDHFDNVETIESWAKDYQDCLLTYYDAYEKLEFLNQYLKKILKEGSSCDEKMYEDRFELQQIINEARSNMEGLEKLWSMFKKPKLTLKQPDPSPFFDPTHGTLEHTISAFAGALIE